MRSPVPDIEIGSLRLSEADPDAFDHALDAAERARADRYVRREDRDRFRLGRGLLRRMLAAELGRSPASLRFLADAHGKPILDGPCPLAFNLSHSGDLVLAAIGRVAAIGIDVERRRDDLDLRAVGAEVYTPGEIAAIAAASPGGRAAVFFDLWTFKEALLKGIGTGFVADPRSVEIRIGPDGARAASARRSDPDPCAPWRIERLSVPAGYHAALAVLPHAVAEPSMPDVPG
ncbi:4'-phosphopantetheinyl transferase superfamily protein [Aureimonas sp. Leaf454]|uniref:4'-phosphopantetheinyl transferase family protein n=1 Tax=Aureimonas sp. Leaf454 TaxID=1736381 RepID=UPI0006F4186D|nr:4'-phosphopantetheinyl transferase superfamily protein [Aureimonas sp. Leaf454]